MSGPHPDPSALSAQLEHAAVVKAQKSIGSAIDSSVSSTAAELAANLSIAISLKRIADTLTGGGNTYALNELMENAGHAFALGMQGRR